MTDWRTLNHAYGNAADVAGLLEQLSPEPEASVWEELWSRLCHQGTVYSASFAALPALADAAERWNPKERAMVLALAASILASEDLSGGVRDDLFRPDESVVRRFQRACRESLAETGLSKSDFIYILQAARPSRATDSGDKSSTTWKAASSLATAHTAELTYISSLGPTDFSRQRKNGWSIRKHGWRHQAASGDQVD